MPDVPRHLDQLGKWALAAIAAYEAEVTKRADTAGCLDGLRDRGVIR